MTETKTDCVLCGRTDRECVPVVGRTGVTQMMCNGEQGCAGPVLERLQKTKTFDDLWVSLSANETNLIYIAKPGVAWSDLEAWLKNEWREKYWRWRKFGNVVVVWKGYESHESDDSEEDE